MLEPLDHFFRSLNPNARVGAMLILGFLLAVITRLILLNGLKLSLKRKYPKLSYSLASRLRLAIILFFPILYFNFLLHGNKDLAYYDQLNQLTRILFIISVAVITIAVANVLEDMLNVRFAQQQTKESEVKRIQSQVAFLKKLLIIFIVVVAVALVLMSFEKVRELGTSILASAGIVGVILGFAAQKSIANLLAGVEIAFNHSLKIDDFVVVEKEYGKVEEINLTSVVVRLWDQRRMILPITHFTDQPFENWTRKSTAITMSIYMYLDYKIPLAELRQKYTEIVQQCAPLWDGNVCKLIVTDFSEKSMQVRATASAEDPDKAFELRALLREKLIEYINERFPEFLPRVRMGELD